MQTTKVLKLSLVLLLVITANPFLQAQDPQRAANAYNWAVQNFRDDVDKSIDSLEYFLTAADSLLEADVLEGQIKEQIEELKGRASNHLPTFYFLSAQRLYQQKRTDMAIDRFKETIEVAEAYESEEIKDRAQQLLPRAYFRSASDAMDMMDYQKAVDHFGEALKLDPQWSRAHLEMALAYRSMDNNSRMIAALEDAIEVARENQDHAVEERAVRMAQSYYWRIGANALSNQENEQALELFKKARDLNPSESYSYYYISLTKNRLYQYSQAIEQARKGLELLEESEEDDREQEAMFYLQLGSAHATLGQMEEGCEYLHKAKYGNTRQRAEREISTFQCPPQEE